jgi:hypothetical protein
MHASKWCRQAFIFTGTDDPNVASFDVVLGKGGSGGGNALVHVHPLAEERFLVTSGRIKVVFDGRPQRASKLAFDVAENEIGGGHDGGRREGLPLDLESIDELPAGVGRLLQPGTNPVAPVTALALRSGRDRVLLRDAQ